MFSLVTTKAAVLVVAVTLALAAAPGALAWSWPASGDVLAPFVVAPSDYEAGQHRGIDVGGAAGEPALAPAAGTVRFAGTLPRHGRTLTIETTDGYTVTLLHLGSLSVASGADVSEG
jgi:murein DD-endopeptidase MepM/ murein hydrolase activator NlpD